jgi:hypothetical protein
MYKYSNFGLVEAGVNHLPDDPKKIYDLAMQYRTVKGKIDTARNAVIASKPKSFIGKVDDTISDIGSGVGLGLTMAGAKLRQIPRTTKVGTILKKEGVSTLLDEDKKRLYGIAVPAAGLVGGGALLSKVANKHNNMPTDNYD